MLFCLPKHATILSFLFHPGLFPRCGYSSGQQRRVWPSGGSGWRPGETIRLSPASTFLTFCGDDPTAVTFIGTPDEQAFLASLGSTGAASATFSDAGGEGCIGGEGGGMMSPRVLAAGNIEGRQASKSFDTARPMMHGIDEDEAVQFDK